MEYALSAFSRTTQHEKDMHAVLPATLINMVCPSFLEICSLAVAGFASRVFVGAHQY